MHDGVETRVRVFSQIAGATRCLRKPFKPRTLLAVIDECLVEMQARRA